jgi:hypothetical protein
VPSVASKTHLLGGDDWPVVAARAAAWLPQVSSRLAVLSANFAGNSDRPFVAALVPALRTRSSEFAALAVPSALSGWLKARAQTWVEVDLGERGDRLSQATMPKSLYEAEAVVAINDLTSFNPRRPVIAIGIWAQFAHPRQRLGAAWSDQASGLTEEIALAAPPATYLLAASWRGKPMLIVSSDMVATELVGLAIGQVQADPDVEHVGPWEQPLIQRAGDLGLGARLPSEIDLSVEWLGGDELRADFQHFGDSIAARIGVASSE